MELLKSVVSGRAFRDAAAMMRMPEVTVNLRVSATAENDAFYARVVKAFYEESQRPHPKLPFVKALGVGFALCELPDTAEAYFAMIEASARRNCKKAQRLGYAVQKIRYNDWLADVAAIRASAAVRQGELPEEFLKGGVEPIGNPESRTRLHDYPFWGVVKEGRLWAYANCLVAGEICMIEHMFGHAERQADGVVPLLIVEMAGAVRREYPSVKYYSYGTYFGAGVPLRRFKRKFGFVPHRVKWVAG